MFLSKPLNWHGIKLEKVYTGYTGFRNIRNCKVEPHAPYIEITQERDLFRDLFGVLTVRGIRTLASISPVRSRLAAAAAAHGCAPSPRQCRV